MSEATYEPRVVGFFCNWCSYRAADGAGSARMKHAPNVRVIRVMCSGRVDPQFILKAFAAGADGVLIAGCHPGECHYIEQNYKAMRRHAMLEHTVGALGIDPRRVRLQWASAAEANVLAAAIDEFIGQLRELGPLNWSQNVREDPAAIQQLMDEIAHEHEEAMEVPV